MKRSSGWDRPTNGAEGLEHMRNRRPCLVLLDLMMPVMNGEQFRRAQLADPSLAAVPVVCISAVYNAQERASRLSAIACIEKPFDVMAIVDVVREQCLASNAALGRHRSG